MRKFFVMLAVVGVAVGAFVGSAWAEVPTKASPDEWKVWWRRAQPGARDAFTGFPISMQHIRSSQQPTQPGTRGLPPDFLLGVGESLATDAGQDRVLWENRRYRRNAPAPLVSPDKKVNALVAHGLARYEQAGLLLSQGAPVEAGYAEIDAGRALLNQAKDRITKVAPTSVAQRVPRPADPRVSGG